MASTEMVAQRHRLKPPHPHSTNTNLCAMRLQPGLSFWGGKKKKRVRNANRNERSRGRSLLTGHGTFSTSKVGGWRLVAVGGPWGLSLRAVLNKNEEKNPGSERQPWYQAGPNHQR